MLFLLNKKGVPCDDNGDDEIPFSFSFLNMSNVNLLSSFFTVSVFSLKKFILCLLFEF